MWSGPPKSQEELLDRAIKVPWLIAGLGIVVAAIALVIVLVFERNLNGFSHATPRDKLIWGVLIGLACLSLLVWAPLSARDHKILKARGRRTRAVVEDVSMVSKGGARPVTISYQVDGRTIRRKSDEPESDVEQMQDHPFDVLYDPQKPTRAMILVGSLSTLPLKPADPSEPARSA